MSVLANPDCILDTPVTWADMERKLRNSLKTNATFGPAKTVTVIGEDSGYASRCGLIYCDWMDAEAHEQLPRAVLIKVPSCAPMLDFLKPDAAMLDAMEDKLRELHNVEVSSYDFFEQFEGLKVPRLYYGSTFTDEDTKSGQLCLEFMENSRVMNFHEDHSVEQLKQIARALGAVQASSLKKEWKKPEANPDTSKKINIEKIVGTTEVFKSLLDYDGSDKTKELLSNIDDTLPIYVASTLPLTIHKQMGFRPVMVNKDLKTENVLIDKDSGDLLALIDWQSTNYGVGVQDLQRIMLFALPAKERRESSAMLVKEMHASMVANLDGAEPPYSVDKLQSLYDILFPHCATYFAGGALVLITKLTDDSNLPVEEMEKRRTIKYEKIIGALEDILIYHDKNKDLVKDLKFRDD